MRFRKLGNTDLQLSVIGCGTWAMAGAGWKYSWGPQEDGLSARAIYRAMDLGINWIDTAAVYGLGHSEEVVGRSLKGIRERPLVATSTFTNPDGSLFSRIKKESIRLEAEKAQRLGIEAIDLYQVHWPLPKRDRGGLADHGRPRGEKGSAHRRFHFSVGQMEKFIRFINRLASAAYSLSGAKSKPIFFPSAAAATSVICCCPLKGFVERKIRRSAWDALGKDHRRKDPCSTASSIPS
jgi:aryl-alcohol dehydrogenase-like predicted oxidoreductase